MIQAGAPDARHLFDGILYRCVYLALALNRSATPAVCI